MENGLTEATIRALYNPAYYKLFDFMKEQADSRGYFFMTRGARVMIIDTLMISTQTVTNSVVKLKSMGLITGSKGTYKVLK